MTRWYISTVKTNVAKENVGLDFPLKKISNKKVSSRKDKTEWLNEWKA